MKNLRSFVLAASLLLVSGGCSDLFGPGDPDVGELSFRFGGAESGVFSARGARQADWGAATHAAGLRYEHFLNVSAYRITSTHLADAFWFHGPAVVPGTYAFGPQGAATTIYGELALDSRRVGNSARAIYALTEGTLVVERADEQRIRGRFSGTARLLNGTAVIQVRDGRFDVPNTLPLPVD